MPIFCKSCKWRFARNGTRACKKHKCAEKECKETRARHNAFCVWHGNPFDPDSTMVCDDTMCINPLFEQKKKTERKIKNEYLY